MQKSKFAFDLAQRVFLPAPRVIGDAPKQAVIVARKEFGWRENEYCLQCLNDWTFDKDGCLVVEHWAVAESELIAAQSATVRASKSPSRKRR